MKIFQSYEFLWQLPTDCIPTEMVRFLPCVMFLINLPPEFKYPTKKMTSLDARMKVMQQQSSGDGRARLPATIPIWYK